MNNCCIIGNLTKNPETTTANDLTITKFSVAVNDYKDETSFFDFAAFGKSAEFIRDHFTKGKSIAVVARAKQERWEKDGQKRSKVVFYVERAMFCGSKADNGGGSKEDDPFA